MRCATERGPMWAAFAHGRSSACIASISAPRPVRRVTGVREARDRPPFRQIHLRRTLAHGARSHARDDRRPAAAGEQSQGAPSHALFAEQICRERFFHPSIN